MKTMLLTSFAACAILGGLARAQETAEASAQAMSTISRSANTELAKSIEELDALRASIAAEKLPLAQALTAAEEKLSDLRREHDRVARLADSGNLEIASMQARVKSRQEELAYVGNLLDEYVKTFETKVHVSELQTIGPAIESAKLAPANVTLTRDERFERQLGLAKKTIERLFDAIGGMRFDGVAVDLQGSVVHGTYALFGPVALFRADQGAVAGVVIPQSGSSNPLVRPLEGAMQTGLAALVETGEGLLPLDPSRGGALKALVQKTNLWHVFQKGGPIMWPLLVASILALATVLERLVFLAMERVRRDRKALEAFYAAVQRGDMQAAVQLGERSKDFVVRMLAYAISHVESSLGSALEYAQAREMKRFQRGIPILDTVITLAPLLGLLGTVTGMMGSFSLIGGELSSPGAITGGIAEALIATAFGLGIAITALLPFNFLNARLDEARHELESAASQIELLASPHLATHALETVRSPSAAITHEEIRRREAEEKRASITKRIAELQSELELTRLDEKSIVPHRAAAPAAYRE